MKPYVLSTQSLSVPRCGFYVYELIDPENNLPFYVGKGTRRRCFQHMSVKDLQQHSHKTHTIRQILNKGLQVVVSVVLISLNELECLQHERTLIAKYGKRPQRGLLTNILDGGEHSAPVPKTPERREEQRRLWLGEANPTKGRKRTQEELEAIRTTRQVRIASGQISSTKHTEEYKQQLRQCNPGGEATSRAIYQIDCNTGKILTTWKSLRSAGLELGIRSWRNISYTLSNFPNRIVGGFYWRWVDAADDVVDGYLQNITQLNTIRVLHSNAKHYIIIQRDDMENETKWENMLIAMRATGIHNSGISAATKSGKKYGGFYWERRER